MRLYDINHTVEKHRRKLYDVAKAGNRVKRVYNLIHDWNTMKVATRLVLSNKGGTTAGTDDMTKYNYSLTDLESLRDALRKNVYKADLVRRTYIPKADGSKRPLGIPTINDRIVQMSARLILEPIAEAHFLPYSIGFRPNRSTWDALIPIQKESLNKGADRWVLEGDLKGAFDNVSHQHALYQTEQWVTDNRLLRLIRQWLRAGIMEELKVTNPTSGTPQGGVISPLLFNIALHTLDETYHRHFPEWKVSRLLEPERFQGLTRKQQRRVGTVSQPKDYPLHMRYIRYADDFVIVGKSKTHLQHILTEVTRWIEPTGIQLNLDKTKITRFSEGFTFLGVFMRTRKRRNFVKKKFKFKATNSDKIGDWAGQIEVRPDQERMTKFLAKLREHQSRATLYMDDIEHLEKTNEMWRGFFNYHRFGQPISRIMGKIGHQTYMKQFYWLKHKHKLNSKETGRKFTGRDPYGRVTIKINRYKYSRGQTFPDPLFLFQPKSWEGSKYEDWRGSKYYYTSQIPIEKTNRKVAYTEIKFNPDGSVYSSDPRYNDRIYRINRMKRLAKDGFLCQDMVSENCLYDKRLDVHHINKLPVLGTWLKLTRNEQRGYHSTRNLITLCRNCHTLK
jgi:RNA-directed DNA polymerase